MKPKSERIEMINRARERAKLFGTVNAYARNRDSEPVDPIDDDAVCWCALGALRKVFNATCEHDLRSKLGFDTLQSAMPYMQALVDANDENRDALDAAFDQLIAALPEDGAL